MASGSLRGVAVGVVLACALLVSACGRGSGLFKQQYEYEEEIYLSLDGSATVNVNASVPALVALRGVDLRIDPNARVDRQKVRALFEGPGVNVTRVSLSRRNRRRFVHVSLDVADVRQLSRIAPFSWSTYRLQQEGDVVDFTQVLGPSAAKPVGNVGWRGDELVAFRMHLPSRVPYHNSPDTVQRGNILSWEQPLRERLAGAPLDLEVHMEPESILYTTLLLFGSTVAAAALTFALVIWWVVRRGRDTDLLESRP
jgi:hypothetical protein